MAKRSDFSVTGISSVLRPLMEPLRDRMRRTRDEAELDVCDADLSFLIRFFNNWSEELRQTSADRRAKLDVKFAGRTLVSAARFNKVKARATHPSTPANEAAVARAMLARMRVSVKERRQHAADEKAEQGRYTGTRTDNPTWWPPRS